MGELERRPNAWALTPLVVFLLTYLVVSIVAGDFYKMPITVAFVISCSAVKDRFSISHNPPLSHLLSYIFILFFNL